MKTTTRLGDTVTGNYHGVEFTGTLRSFDGSGYLYVSFAEPIVVRGIARDEVAIHPDSDERDSLKVVARPEVAPAAKMASSSCGGGAYLTPV